MTDLGRRRFLALGAAIAGGALLSGWSRPGARKPAGGTPVYLPLVMKGGPTTLQVGPTRLYNTPSAAAAAAKDGAVVEIDAGTYTGDVATWTQNNLTLRGVGGLAHLAANGNNAGGKAIWVIQGHDTTVENIEFSGATVPDQNGAGIRQEGANLTVRGCYFHDNEEGILAGDHAGSEILIEYTEFARNGFGDGYSHNLYINHVAKFTLQYCYSHHAVVGHLVKSRALENHILYNRIMDEATGTSSYAIDLPNGGLSYLIGNLVQHGPDAQNSTLVTYAEEGASNPAQELWAVNNTLVNDRPAGGTFMRVAGTPTGAAINNLCVGPGTTIVGALAASHNMLLAGTTLVDRAGYDYHLTAGSAAINAGIDPGLAHGSSLAPVWEYVHPLSRTARPLVGALDVGAYEF